MLHVTEMEYAILQMENVFAMQDGKDLNVNNLYVKETVFGMDNNVNAKKVIQELIVMKNYVKIIVAIMLAIQLEVFVEMENVIVTNLLEEMIALFMYAIKIVIIMDPVLKVFVNVKNNIMENFATN